MHGACDGRVSGLLVPREVVVGTGVDALDLLPAHREAVLDVLRGVGVVGELLVDVPAQVVGAHAVVEVPLETLLAPCFELLELVGRHRVTALFFVPAIYKLITLREDLASYELSSVRLAAYGGAPMDPDTIRALRRIFPGVEMHNCYGLTESSSLATVLPSEAALSRADSVGRPVPETLAEVRNEAGEPLPPGWLETPGAFGCGVGGALIVAGRRAPGR